MEPDRQRKRGWYLTTFGDAHDGTFWFSGLRMGRVHRIGNGRYVWRSYCGDCEWGTRPTKEEAKREVEARAELGRITAKCWPASR